MRRRALLALLAALALLGLALALWTGRGEPDGPTPLTALETPEAPAPVPRPLRSPRPGAERARPGPASGGPEEGARRPLDRFERAIASDEGAFYVAEMNAIRHSPLVAALVECGAAPLARAQQRLRDAMGIDLFEEVDRVMVSEHGTVVSGFFSGRRPPPGWTASSLGSATLFEKPGERTLLATVGDDLVLAFDDRAELEAALARVEGRAPAELPRPLRDAEGDVYGPLDPAWLGGLMGKVPAWASLSAALGEGSFGASIDDDVRLTFQLDGAGGASPFLDLVARGLAELRLEASASGDEKLRRLLQGLELDPGEGGVALRLALPGEVLLEEMGCGPRRPVH